MTEQEAINALKLEGGIEITGDLKRISIFFEALDIAILALKEIQNRRKSETVEEKKHIETGPVIFHDDEIVSGYEYDPCEGCLVEGTNDEDFYWPGQGPCDHCSRRR